MKGFRTALIRRQKVAWATWAAQTITNISNTIKEYQRTFWHLEFLKKYRDIVECKEQHLLQ